ncbi:MAG: ADP-ribosylglycohydrolase family protein [Planctomycetota bacterium]
MKVADRTAGSLLGLAVGNALGAPLDRMGPEQIQIRHGTVREMIGGGWLLLRPGQTTTPVALARRVAESLVEKRGLDGADVGARFASYYRTAPKDVSGALRTALAMLADGADPAEIAARVRELTGEDSADHGTLARAVPLALAFRARDKLQAAAAREARVTHFDPTAGAASAALAVLLSFLLSGKGRAEAFDLAWDWLEEHSREIPNVLPDVPARTETEIAPGSLAVAALETAVWYFLTSSDFEETVVRVANRGGEAAVTTAVAGALAGARWGVGAIPVRWLKPLADRTVLRHLAGDLLQASA